MRRSSSLVLLGLSLAFALGCGGAGNSDAPLPPSGTVTSTNSALFDPANSVVPLPNVLATATATDPLAGRAANKPMTPPEALAYVNLHEVGGTNAVSGVNAPIYIRFAGSVDATTVTPANVKVFQVTPDSAGTENNPLGFTDVSGMFSYQYKVGGTDLFLFPNFPLMPGTRYAYVVTNRVKDAATGAPLAGSAFFEALKSTSPLTGQLAALEPIRANVTAGGQILFSGYAKVMDDLIAASSTTTVASRGDISLLGRFITTAAGAISANTPSPSDSGAVLLPMESAIRKFAAGTNLGGLPGKTWSNAATVTMIFNKNGGVITPDAYWQQVTGSPSTTAPASVGIIAIGTLSSADLNVDPVVASANAATMDLNAVTGAYNPAAGVTQAFRDGSNNLLGFYHTDRAVNFVYIAPDPALVTRPTNGYPLVIYQHGITSQKETVIALAGTLTAQGYAVIAIDLPLHGQNQVSGHTTGAEWGQDFMALGAPLATRTNMQQAVLNLTRLEFVVKTGGLSTALATAGFAANTPDITTSPSNIKFVGVSLGAIVGADYLASNTTLSPTGYPYTQSTLNNDMKGFLNCPGGRLAYLIANSPEFGPVVNAGLAAVGVNQGTPTYNAFFQVTQSIVDPTDPATLTTPLASGLPSRLSGRITIQEATSSAFDAYGNTTSTDGDQVITNTYTRYFANALGGRAVLGTSAAAAVGPNFSQVGYLANGAFTVGSTSTAHAAGVVGNPFMFTLSPTPAPKVVNADASVLGTSPTEGYFQFDQTGIGHAFILNPANPVAITLAQRQFVYWLGTGLVVDPTQQSATLPIVQPAPLPKALIFQAPKTLTILGY